MKLGEIEITVDPFLPPNVAYLMPDFGKMTAKEIEEFWDDPCWTDYFIKLVFEDERDTSSN